MFAPDNFLKRSERANVLLGLALVLPLVIYLVFTAYRLGIQSKFIPAVQSNMQALLNIRVNNPVAIHPHDVPNNFSPPTENSETLKLFIDGVTANIQHIVATAPSALGITGAGGAPVYNYSLYMSAWSLFCSNPIDGSVGKELITPHFIAEQNALMPAMNNPAEPSGSPEELHDHQGKSCFGEFADPSKHAKYCDDRSHIFVCYAFTANIENPPPSITTVSQVVLRPVTKKE